jgi:UPF0755 protein
MKRSLILFLLLLVIFLGLVSILVGWVVSSLPQEVQLAFGPPAKNLDTWQRFQLSVKLFSQEEILKTPADPNGESQPFRVQLGESTYAITNHLQAQRLITDAGALRDYLVYSGLDTTLQAGDYTLSARMTPVEIAHTLQDATPSEIAFHILPGWRLEEIAASLPTSGLEFTAEAFLAAAANPPTNLPMAQAFPPSASLEGFLYPDSYRLPRQISVTDFLSSVLGDFQSKVDNDIQLGFQNQGLSLFQAVTLASIVQREAVVEDEMPQIASVFLNRLAAGMRLDSDPTVQYALGFNPAQNTWWTNPLSLDNLTFDSPHNTYLYPGLPPSPIANPGLAALRAVAFAAHTPYYYFRAACDGSGRHLFAETFEQHQNNACK